MKSIVDLALDRKRLNMLSLEAVKPVVLIDLIGVVITEAQTFSAMMG